MAHSPGENLLNRPLVWAEPKLWCGQGHIQYLDGRDDDEDEDDDDDDDDDDISKPWCRPAEWFTSSEAKAPFQLIIIIISIDHHRNINIDYHHNINKAPDTWLSQGALYYSYIVNLSRDIHMFITLLGPLAHWTKTSERTLR